MLQRAPPDEEDDGRFFSLALLSHIAVRLQDRIRRGTYVKDDQVFDNAFTGKDIIVSTES